MSATHETAIEAAKIAPPAVVSGAQLFGVSVPDLISVLTLIYLIGLIIHQMPKHVQGVKAAWQWVKAWRQKRE